MKKLLLFLLAITFISSVHAQYDSTKPRQFISANGYDYKNIKAINALGIPTDTIPLAVRDSGFIAAKSGLIWIWDGFKWVPGSSASSVDAYTKGKTDSIKPQYVADIAALQAYAGSANTVIVQDSLRGGIFSYIVSGSPDSMTVFNRAGGGYWLRNFNKGVYNILWAGVNNKGSGDQAALINYVSSKVPSGSAVYFPHGTYLASSLRLINHVILFGDGLGTNIKTTTPGATLLTLGYGSDFSTIRDLNLSGNVSSAYGAGATTAHIVVLDTTTHITFNNVTFSGSAGNAIQADSTGDVNNIIINNCIVSNSAAAGIHIVSRNSTNQINVVNISNTTVVNNAGNNIELFGISLSVQNSTIEGSLKRGIVVSSDFVTTSNNSASINISSNYFETCDSGFILIKAKTGFSLAIGISIENNLGNYNTNGVNSIVTDSINVCEVQDPSYVGSSVFYGFLYKNNSFSSTLAVKSIFNGNNVLSNASVIMPTDISTSGLANNIKNIGNAMMLYGNRYVNLADSNVKYVSPTYLGTQLSNYIDKTTNQTIGGFKTFSNQIKVLDGSGATTMDGASIYGNRSAFYMGNQLNGGTLNFRGDAIFFKNAALTTTYGAWGTFALEIYNQLKIDSVADGTGNFLTRSGTNPVKYRTPAEVKSDLAITYPDIPAGAISNNTTATTQAAKDNSTKLATTGYVDRALSAKADTGTVKFITTKGIISDTTSNPGYITLSIDSSYVVDSIMGGNSGISSSGTYTPTITGVANYTAGTASVCQYSKVGNTVTVWGKITVQPTTTATITTFSLSLPAAATTTFTNSYQAAGTGGGIFSSVYYPYVISSASSGSVLNVSFISNQTSGQQDCQFHATYQIQ